jgi:hypothetical protein
LGLLRQHQIPIPISVTLDGSLCFFFSLSNDDGDEVARHTVPTCIFLLC